VDSDRHYLNLKPKSAYFQTVLNFTKIKDENLRSFERVIN
jgi:hypothetical protein